MDLWGYDSPDKAAVVLPRLEFLLRDSMGEMKVTTITHFGDFQGGGCLGILRDTMGELEVTTVTHFGDFRYQIPYCVSLWGR